MAEWDDAQKERFINLFTKFFNYDELKAIATAVENSDPQFKEMMKEVLKLEVKENRCLACEDPVNFEHGDTIIVNGALIEHADKKAIFGFCNKACLKSWCEKNL